MAITELVISYPDFKWNEIIDPEEFDTNNNEIVTKVNEVIGELNLLNDKLISTEDGNSGADNIKVTPINGIVGETIQSVLEGLKAISDELDSKKTDKSAIYLKAEIDDKISTLQSTINIHKSSSDHDNRYYTKSELTPWLRGGDTNIKEEVFIITNPDNGDGTFSYSSDGNNYIGILTEEGYQVFDLQKGHYEPNLNRIYVIVGDTLRRSAVSGGIIELTNTSFALTAVEGAGAEITAVYYERLGMSAEYNIKLSKEKPPANNGKNMWFELIG